MPDDWSDWAYDDARPSTPGTPPVAPGSVPPPADPNALTTVLPPTESSGAPVLWLAAAAIAASAGLALGILGRMRPGIALAGWLLGGFVSIGLLTVFSLKDARARAGAWYVKRTEIAIGQVLAVLLAVAAVVASGYHFADWAGRTWG